MGYIIDLPTRLQGGLQESLLRTDPEAHIVTGLHPDAPGGWRRSVVGVGRATWRLVREMKRSDDVRDQIFFCMTSSPAYRAQARRLRYGTYCLVLWLGAILRLQGAFLRLVVMPPLAEAIGLVPRPNIALPPADGGDPYSNFERLWLADTTPFQDQWEHKIASILNGHLHSFVVLHELGHILNGHLAFRGGPPIINEHSDPVERGADETLTRHTLEMDADAFAAIRVFASALAGELPEGVSPAPSRALELRRRLFFAVMAVYLACRGLERQPFNAETFARASHPSGALRLVMVLPLAKAAWLQVVGTDGPSFPEDIFHVTISLCEQAIEAATSSQGRQFRLTAEVPQEWASAYHERLLGRWATLRPLLDAVKPGTHQLAPAIAAPS